MNNRWLLSLALAVSVSLLAACGGETGDAGASASPEAQQDAGAQGAAAEQPDLSGVPEVVAEVNGEPISREEFSGVYESQFQQLAIQAQMSGQPVNQDQLKKQTVENLVGTELLVQEAGSRGFKASERDVRKTLEELARSNQMKSARQFVAALQDQGMKKADITSQVETQVRVEKLLADEAGTLTVTDKELKAAYQQMVAQQKQAGDGKKAKIPSLKEVRPQLKEQLRSRKEAEAAQGLIAQLRKAADVTIHL
jgi:hypothetical protein